jgi:mannose-1-phosphate guanylyltransferase / mannose-6-phosphate isomerase
MTTSTPHQNGTTKAVILAGGSGSRLWPLSRQHLPKQFLKLNGTHSLLQGTVSRLQPLIAAHNVLIVTGEEHAKGEAYKVLTSFQTLLEPIGRNTAPAIAIAAAYLQQQGDDPVMVVLPADHIIKDVNAFQTSLKVAIEAAQAGLLVTFGIQPDRPDTGFGYIKTSSRSTTLAIQSVERFTEKPDQATAKNFLQEGGFYWNSGMFVWKSSTILQEIRQHLPEVDAVLNEILADVREGETFALAVKKHFHHMPSISIDYGVLEKCSKVSLVPCEIGWSDVGSWDAVYDMAEKDAAYNTLQGNVLAIDCKNTLIRSDKRLVAAVGVENLCVVETADAILISPRGQSQRVREVVDALKENGAKEQMAHVTVQRPWGSYTLLEDEHSGCKIKRITVIPGGKLSLQSHQHRSEHWVVVSGTATVTRGEENFTVEKNESTYISIGTKHRLENRGVIPLHIIEVQVGEYVEEDDIQRFDDHYGRDVGHNGK